MRQIARIAVVLAVFASPVLCPAVWGQENAQRPPAKRPGAAPKPKPKDSLEPKLQAIGDAFMKRVEDKHEEFPDSMKRPDGTTPLSWRVQILPYFGDEKLQALYDKFHHDEDWDSPHNKALVKEMPDIYKTPGKTLKPGMTQFQMFVGENTLVREPPPQPPERADVRIDAEQAARPVRMADVIDGLANTVAVVHAGPEAAGEWTRPGGLSFDPADPYKPVGKVPKDILWSVFCDGTVHDLNVKKVPGELLALFIRPRDGVNMEDAMVVVMADQQIEDQQAQLKRNMGQVAKAVLAYKSKNKSLPPSGEFSEGIEPKLTLSWRVHILPFLGEKELYFRFKPEENPAGPPNRDNRQNLDGSPPSVFHFPGTPKDRSAYHVFVGPGTPFVKDENEKPQEFTAPPKKTLMFIVSPAGPREDSQGGSVWSTGGGIQIVNLLHEQPLRPITPEEYSQVGESPAGDRPANLPPADVETIYLPTNFGRPRKIGFPIAMFDGSVRLLSPETSRTTLLRLIDPTDKKEDLDIDEVAPLWK